MRFQHDQWQNIFCAQTVEADSDAQVAGNMFLIGIIEVAVKTPEKKHTVETFNFDVKYCFQKNIYPWVLNLSRNQNALELKATHHGLYSEAY